MKHLLDSLNQSIDQKNWYAALLMSLTLPDIAGKIEFPNDCSRKRFAKWFDIYIKHKYPITDLVYFGIEGMTLGYPNQQIPQKEFLTGEECYAIRCSFLHQGIYSIEGQNVKKDEQRNTLPVEISDKITDYFRFIIQEENRENNTNIQWINEKKILQIHVDKFCNDIKDGLEKWLTDIESNQIKQKEFDKFLKIFEYKSIQ